MAIINRIKTIIGDDATFFSAISRLFFYVKVSNPFTKIVQKTFAGRADNKPFVPVFRNQNEQIEWEFIAQNTPEKKLEVEQYIYQNKISAELIPTVKNHFLFQFKPQSEPLISIIIPTKNKSELVKQCVDSIVKQTTYKHFEIILVDNRSDEVALKELIHAYQQQTKFVCKHVLADIEFNFSALMNLGIECAKGEYLVLLNNDTQIITPAWLEYMLGFAQQQQVGAVGCKLLYPNQTIQHAGILLNASVVPKHVHVGAKRDEDSVNKIVIFPSVTAACLMVNKVKVNEVGGFDELFKVEFNDIDFCLKLQANGYHNVYLPQVEIFHYESASRRHPFSDNINYQRYISESMMFRKKWAELLG